MIKKDRPHLSDIMFSVASAPQFTMNRGIDMLRSKFTGLMISGVAVILITVLLIYPGTSPFTGDLFNPPGSSGADASSEIFTSASDVSDIPASDLEHISSDTLSGTSESQGSDISPVSQSSGIDPTAAPKASVPSWYSPGRLAVLTLTHPNPYMYSAIPLSVSITSSKGMSLPSGTVADPRRTKWADYVAIASSESYPNEDGLFYDLPNSRILRFSHEAAAALTKASKLPSGGYFQFLYTDPSTGHTVVEVRTAAHDSVGAFYFNFYSKKIVQLPDGFINCTYNMISPDGNKLAMIITNDQGLSELVILDISSGTPVRISVTDGQSGKYTPTERMFFTDSGKYLIYETAGEDGGFTDKDGLPYLAVYNIKTGKTVRIKGYFVRAVREDAFIVIERGGKGCVVSSDTGDDVSASFKPEIWESIRIQLDLVKIAGGSFRQNVSGVSLFGLDAPKISVKLAGAAAVSGPYLYVYNSGAQAIKCIHTGTGSSFDVPVDSAFVKEVNGLKSKGLEADFYFNVSSDRTFILLQYTAHAKQDEAVYGPYYHNYGFWKLFLESDDISDFSEYVDEGIGIKLGEGAEVDLFKDTSRFYIVEGEGYTSLIAVDDRSCQIAVEDYRDRTFTLYRSDNTYPWLTPPAIYDVTGDDPSIPVSSFRRRLSPSASADSSRSLYASLKRLDPYYDYADFYTAGVLDNEKIRLWQFRPEMAEPENCLQCGITDVSTAVDGCLYGYFISDRETLRDLLTEICRLPEMKPLTDKISGKVKLPEQNSELWTGKERVDFVIRMDGDCKIIPRYQQICEIMPGIDRDGRYVMQTHAGYCYMTKSQYDRIISLCRLLYKTVYDY